MTKRLLCSYFALLLLALPTSAADVTTAYGTTGQTITCTLASLANTGVRSCAAIDNRTNKFMDALIFIKFLTGASGAAATGYINIYAGGTVDDGTTYTDAGGTDAALTPKNVRIVTACAAGANATTYRCGPFSLRPVFGGSLPALWFIAIENQTGTTLDSTEGNHAKLYQGVKGTVQ